MDLISLVVMLIILGLVIYLVRLLPIDAVIKNIIWVVLVIIAVLWLLGSLGGYPLMYHPFLHRPLR